MRLLTKLSVALPVFLSFFSSSQAHQLSGKRHFGRRHEQDLSIRAPGDMGVYKRFDGVRFTFYAPGLGACGAVSSSQDFVSRTPARHLLISDDFVYRSLRSACW